MTSSIILSSILTNTMKNWFSSVACGVTLHCRQQRHQWAFELEINSAKTKVRLQPERIPQRWPFLDHRPYILNPKPQARVASAPRAATIPRMTAGSPSLERSMPDAQNLGFAI